MLNSLHAYNLFIKFRPAAKRCLMSSRLSLFNTAGFVGARRLLVTVSGPREISIHVALWFKDRPLVRSVLEQELLEILRKESRDLVIYVDMINTDKSVNIVSQKSQDLLNEEVNFFKTKDVGQLLTSAKERELVRMYLDKVCDILTRASAKCIVIPDNEGLVTDKKLLEEKAFPEIVRMYKETSYHNIICFYHGKKLVSGNYYINLTEEDYLVLQSKHRNIIKEIKIIKENTDDKITS